MKVEINVDQSSYGTVKLDGQEIQNAVSGIELKAESGHVPELTLKLHAEVEVHLDGPKVTLEYPHEHKEIFPGKGARVTDATGSKIEK